MDIAKDTSVISDLLAVYSIFSLPSKNLLKRLSSNVFRRVQN